MKQENVKIGTHGEQYGNWMSNPAFYMFGAGIALAAVLTVRSLLTWPESRAVGIDYWGAVYNYSKVKMVVPGNSKALVGRK